MHQFQVLHILILMVSLTTTSTKAQNHNMTGCKDTCGEVSIPFPFGIGRNCSANEWYSVDCNSSIPYMFALNNVEVLSVNPNQQIITVNVPITSDCDNQVQTSNLFLNKSPFMYSEFDNIFVVEGCGYADIMNNGSIVTGCSTTCRNDTVSDRNNCFGIGCCQTTIPNGLDSISFNLTGLKSLGGDGTCGFAFVVDKDSYVEGRFSRQFVPVSLSGRRRFNEVESQECKICNLNGGLCYRKPGVKGDTCYYYGRRSNKISLGVILGVSISMCLLFITVLIYALYKIIKKNKAKRRKQKFFKRNGGLLLKQQEVGDTSLVEKTILFTSNELEKATDHFNEDRVLGRGGQGTVYKGMLADGRIVAIKKSKVVDESQLKQFINEVVVLSQVNHRNVVKLLGCCLETEVPLLVSEFISNGTLYDIIQDETYEFSMDMRLQIAIEIAGALSYLHSATSIPIYHRDIKTTNILLDEKYRAKVSDFGTSRFVSMDQTHLTTLVKGTFGYLDPEYFQSSQFTEKSDVYSFGVVLLELLTREKPISLARFGEYRNLASHFILAVEEDRVMSVFDEMVVEQGSRSELLALANLAMQCLNSNGKNRPTMKEVAIELENIKLSHVHSMVQTNLEHVKYHEKASMAYELSSSSTTLTFDDNPSQ